jgi:hypothetical protein
MIVSRAAEDAVLLGFVTVKVLVTPEIEAPTLLFITPLADTINPQVNT